MKESPLIVGGRGVSVIVENRAVAGTLLSPQERFLEQRPRIPGKVFDAVRDFGADFTKDATGRVQATIDAARMHGDGAIAFFPAGQYAITRKLVVKGGNYVIGGSGIHTRFRWKGSKGRVLMQVRDPQDIRIRDLQLVGSITRNSIALHQVSSGRGSSVEYDRVVATSGHVVFQGLRAGDRVHIRSIRGNGYITGCDTATILADLWEGASVTVKGSSSVKTAAKGGAMKDTLSASMSNEPVSRGFLGFLVAHVEQLRVYDNADLVVGDMTVGAGRDPLIRAAGETETKAGRLTIGVSGNAGTGGSVALIENYAGTFAYANGRSDSRLSIVQRGDNVVDVVMMGHGRSPLDLDMQASGRTHFVQNLAVNNLMHRNTQSLLTDILDHYAELNMNHAQFFAGK